MVNTLSQRDLQGGGERLEIEFTRVGSDLTPPAYQQTPVKSPWRSVNTLMCWEGAAPDPWRENKAAQISPYLSLHLAAPDLYPLQ